MLKQFGFPNCSDLCLQGGGTLILCWALMTNLFAGTEHCVIAPHGSHPGCVAPVLPTLSFLFTYWDDVGAYAQGVVIHICPLRGCLEEANLRRGQKHSMKIGN